MLPVVEILPAEQRVIIHFSGSVDLSTLVLGREAVQIEPGWSRAYARIFDFTDVVDINRPQEAIEKLAEVPPIFDRSAPQVLVTRPGTFDFVIHARFKRSRRVDESSTSLHRSRRRERSSKIRRATRIVRPRSTRAQVRRRDTTRCTRSIMASFVGHSRVVR